MSQSIASITQSATRVRSMLNDVNQATQERAHGIEQVARAIASMEKVTQTAAATAEESAAASGSLSEQADILGEIVSEVSTLTVSSGKLVAA